MTNSISTTVVEVVKNIHDTVIMASSQPMSKPTTWQFNFILCQVVITKTLTGYDVMVYIKLSWKRHLKQCHICIQNVIIERKTLNDSRHKPYFIFKTYVMSWLWRCHVSLMHTPSSKVLPKSLLLTK